ncbi:stress-induced protein [Candidatus Parcubacteria bacterium]|nr:stress-induced protein [Candidatus Parcubacteria bacterium]
MANSNRGFAAMDEEKQRAIASKGGRSQGKENNPGNFANDREKASEAGRKGGQH